MINTVSTYPTQSKLTSRGSSHFHISDPYKYCSELDLVIQVAKSKGYNLPTDYQLKQLNTAINELISSGIWNSYDLFYWQGYGSLRSIALRTKDITGGVEQRDTIEKFTWLNLKNPLQFECTLIKGNTTGFNNPFYTSFGYKSGNAGGADFGTLNTNWIAGVNSVNWTQNNAGYVVYCSNFDNLATGGRTAGATDTTTNRTSLSLVPFSGSNTIQGNINTSATGALNIGSVTSAVGVTRLQRTASNLTTSFRNGVQVGTIATASQTMIGTFPIFLGSFNTNGTKASGFTRNPTSMHGLGSSLSTTLVKVESDIINQTLIKLQVI